VESWNNLPEAHTNPSESSSSSSIHPIINCLQWVTARKNRTVLDLTSYPAILPAEWVQFQLRKGVAVAVAAVWTYCAMRGLAGEKVRIQRERRLRRLARRRNCCWSPHGGSNCVLRPRCSPSHSQSGLKYHAVSTRWCVAYVLEWPPPSADSAARGRISISCPLLSVIFWCPRKRLWLCAASRTACFSKNSCKGPRWNRKLQWRPPRSTTPRHSSSSHSWTTRRRMTNLSMRWAAHPNDSPAFRYRHAPLMPWVIVVAASKTACRSPTLLCQKADFGTDAADSASMRFSRDPLSDIGRTILEFDAVGLATGEKFHRALVDECHAPQIQHQVLPTEGSLCSKWRALQGNLICSGFLFCRFAGPRVYSCRCRVGSSSK